MSHAAPQLLQASAAIFDMDGTLVDSVDFHAEAWRRAFAAFGFEFDVIRAADIGAIAFAIERRAFDAARVARPASAVFSI